MSEKVILVDDDPSTLAYLKIRLQKAGFDTLVAQSGHEALKKIDTFEPDIIISDLMMPEIDGLELLHKLKNHPKTAMIPFFFISGQTEVSEQLKGLRSGANDYFSKPVRIEELIGRIKQVIEETKLRKKSSMKANSFSGKLFEIQMPDIIQLIEKNMKSGKLTIFNQEFSKVGHLYLDSGHLVDAENGNLQYEEAFFQLWSHKKGYFEFIDTPVSRQRNIKKSNNQLIFEASVMEDEFKELKKYLSSGLNVRLNLKTPEIPSAIVEEVGEKWLFRVVYLIVHGATVNKILHDNEMSSLRAGAILSNLFQEKLLVENTEEK